MPEFPYRLERTIVIRAKPNTIFRFFTDSSRWAAWWGAGSTIDPRPGGRIYIRHPNAVEVLGEILELRDAEHIVFTYGYASGKPIPPGASRVTIRLASEETGTRLHLLHEFAEPGPRDEHVQGWRFQLSLFSNVVTNELYANAASTVDTWFAAWTIADTSARDETLARIAAVSIQFRDRFSLLDGLPDLTAHISAAQRFMPGIRLQRKGDVRHCQGAVLADWIAVDHNAQPRMSGSSVFVLQTDGKIASVTSFANASAS